MNCKIEIEKDISIYHSENWNPKSGKVYKKHIIILAILHIDFWFFKEYNGLTKQKHGVKRKVAIKWKKF